MDAQQLHDQEMLEKDFSNLKPGSKKRLEALLRKKNGPPLEPAEFIAYDPIALAMENNPGLTRERAEELAAAFGF